jgi:ribose 5-phosphate isomerase A
VTADVDDRERGKRAAAAAAAELVEDGMRVGLGTGTTVAYFLPALARRGLDVRCVATSTATAAAATALGLRVEPFDVLDALDVAVDGADQVDDDGWLVKGAGGALTREKVVAAAAARFVVIVDASKRVARVGPPVPVELLGFGLAATLRAVAPTTVRDAPPTPDGGVLADYRGEVADAASTAAWLDGTPGVVAHGLFAPALVATIVVGRGDSTTLVAGGPT